MSATRFPVRALLCALALAGAQVLAAQQPPAASTAPAARRAADTLAIARAREVVRRYVTRVPGIQVAVAQDGRTIWSEGFGWADLEQRVPVTPVTRFRIGSISKSLTATAVGLLVEQGRLDLDAEVQRYVPAFPRKPWPVTVRQTAGHVAGFRHYRGDEFIISRHYPDVTAGLAIFAGDSLLFEPGTRFSYSSYGWNLISAVIEGASGESFLPFMQSHVFAPLGLEHTGPDLLDTILVGRGRYYDRPDTSRPFVNSPFVDNSYKWAGGGFLSTAEDLVRFGSSWLGLGPGPALLRPETVRLLWASQRLRDGRETGYGIGWFVSSDSTAGRVVFHGGGSVGGTSMLLIYPERRLVVAVLTNFTDAPAGAVTRNVAREFLANRPPTR